MVNVESICFLLILAGSLGLFYYLGWVAGRESEMLQQVLWLKEYEDDEDE